MSGNCSRRDHPRGGVVLGDVGIAVIIDQHRIAIDQHMRDGALLGDVAIPWIGGGAWRCRDASR